MERHQHWARGCREELCEWRRWACSGCTDLMCPEESQGKCQVSSGLRGDEDEEAKCWYYLRRYSAWWSLKPRGRQNCLDISVAIRWTEPSPEEENHQGTKTRKAPAESLGRSCRWDEIRRQKEGHGGTSQESVCPPCANVGAEAADRSVHRQSENSSVAIATRRFLWGIADWFT